MVHKTLKLVLHNLVLSLLLSSDRNFLLVLLRSSAPETSQHLRHVRKLVLDVHLGLHLLHLLLGLGILHHLRQHRHQQQRHHHHHDHGVEEDVCDLPLLSLLVVSELSQRFSFDGVGQLRNLSI